MTYVDSSSRAEDGVRCRGGVLNAVSRIGSVIIRKVPAERLSDYQSIPCLVGLPGMCYPLSLEAYQLVANACLVPGNTGCPG
jgi:hypothetical protein